jgi:REP element-mobilizing transposase RayT
MARATRVDFPGAWYHVLNRGTESRAIFRSTRCCEKFIELLSSLPERFGVRLHGYALMGNHYHLQLENREANLSKAVHWLNVSYSVWFNRKYSRVGPLFQGRFKAILHEITAQLARRRVDALEHSIGVPTLSSPEPEQHRPGYVPSPSWPSSVQARKTNSKRRFVNSCGKRQP